MNPLATAINDTPSGKNKLSLNEHSRLVILENTIKKGVVTFVEVGNALTEIKEHELWRDKYKNFDDYCEHRWGWGRSRSQQFMSGNAAMQGLTKENVTAVTNEATARELVKVPAGQRNAVVSKAIEKAKERGKPVSAPIIREVKAEISKNGTHEEKLDDTGYPVPAKALEFWERRFEVKQLIEAVQQVRADIMVAYNHGENSDILYFGKGKLAQTFITEMDDIIRHLKSIMPYAVCPYCQGKIIEQCAYCNKTGVIDRNRFTAAPEELLKLRATVVKK